MNFIEFWSKFTKYGFELFGKYYSIYRGFVVDTEDPEGLCRVKVLVPEISRYRIDRWAFPRNLYSGKGYGIQCLPQKGDIVWVEFEKGNPKYPIYSLGYYGANEKPKEFSENTTYGIVTPGGVTVSIDDKNGYIKATLKSGLGIRVTPKGVSLIVNSGDNRETIFLGNDEQASEYALLGEKTKKRIEQESQRVDLIIEALITSPIFAGDGGALYKSSITTALSSATKPDYSDILSKTVKND